MWYSFITMTTVGYGDIYPVTMIGRIFGCIAALWGGVVLSMIFATAQAFLTLGENERKAYTSILLSSAAAKAILRTLQYHQFPGHRHAVKDIYDWDKVRRAVARFKGLKNEHSLEEVSDDRKTNSTDERLSSLEDQVKSLNQNIGQLLENISAASINRE